MSENNTFKKGKSKSSKCGDSFDDEPTRTKTKSDKAKLLEEKRALIEAASAFEKIHGPIDISLEERRASMVKYSSKYYKMSCIINAAASKAPKSVIGIFFSK